MTEGIESVRRTIEAAKAAVMELQQYEDLDPLRSSALLTALDQGWVECCRIEAARKVGK